MTDEKIKDSIFFVTGLSGAGISTTLKILEDMGCDVFDNFPLQLLEPLLAQQKPHHRPIALGIDTRTRDFDPENIRAAIDNLRSGDEWNVVTFFLNADDSALLKRFTDTRRTHPLARDRSVSDGIAAEKSLLYPLKYAADHVVDTTEFSIHDLRRLIEDRIKSTRSKQLHISVMSFSYRHGVPREADIVFDMRFLKNPNWVPELKEMTGRDNAVQNYVTGDKSYQDFETHLKAIFEMTLPGYTASGKNYLTIAFGCTGGRHRSVTIAEKISGWLGKSGHPVSLHHRELKG